MVFFGNQKKRETEERKNLDVPKGLQSRRWVAPRKQSAMQTIDGFIQTFGRQKDDYTNTVYLEEKTKRLSEFRRLKPRSCVNKGIQGKQQRFNLPRIKTVLKCVPSCENGLNLYSSIPSNLRISLVIESST